MEEIRSRVEGIVASVEVDEGQMVAEEDILAVVQVADAFVAITTEIPGVVRELYVESGRAITVGDLVAMIDES